MDSRLVASCVALAACSVAPQNPGWQRSTYIGMSTGNGVFGGMLGGALVGGLPCLLTMSHKCPQPYGTIAGVGALVGAILGGYLAHDATSDATESPTQNDWILTSIPTGFFALTVVIGGGYSIGKAIGGLASGTPESDRIVEYRSVTFPTETDARRAIAGIGSPCEMTLGKFEQRFASYERGAPRGDALEGVCELQLLDGGWRITVKIVYQVR